MIIKVNDLTIEIFAGAKVGDVLRKYSRTEWKLIQSGEKTVTNRHGHAVGLGGELNGGEELFIKARAAAEPHS